MNGLLTDLFLLVSDVIHTQGPLDGSLYAKVRKKESGEGAAASNGLPATAVERALPVGDHALSVSSDSGNSTASIKTDRTDEAASAPQASAVSPTHVAVGEESSSVRQQAPPAQQPISPKEKKQLEQLLSGLEGPLHRQAYLSTPASAAGAGMLHLVPAQVHVNGHSGIDRETDILDDELPTSQEGNSVDSLGTFSSTDGRATPADIYYHPESVNGQEPVTYLERNIPEKPLEDIQPHVGRSDKGDPTASLETYTAPHNGLFRSMSFGTEVKSMPQAPARSTSSREAVQRGLNVWQRFGVPEEPVTEGITFSPLPSMSTHHSLPQFPHRHSASQEEIEQSIETLNLLMLGLQPSRSAVPKSHSAPVKETVVTTQPSFTQSQTRPSHQTDTPVSGFTKPGSPEPTVFQGSPTYSSATSCSSQVLPSSNTHLQLKPINTFPASIQSQPSDVSESQSAASASSRPIQGEPEEVFNVEGLVAQRVAGKTGLSN